MRTDFEIFNDAYEVCQFLDTLKTEDIIAVTFKLDSFYVFYRCKSS